MCVGGREKMNGDGQELDVAFWAQLHLEQKATSSSRERAQSIARVCAFCVCATKDMTTDRVETERRSYLAAWAALERPLATAKVERFGPKRTLVRM